MVERVMTLSIVLTAEEMAAAYGLVAERLETSGGDPVAPARALEEYVRACALAPLVRRFKAAAIRTAGMQAFGLALIGAPQLHDPD